ncbi:hypothetical protein ACQUWM_09235 [Marinobacter sp. DUT-3]|uniref:hypothetical protein n=1 Tax=Marinobacter sp. DUT-3 TaxID=3412036 RepID=UPI003D1730A1
MNKHRLVRRCASVAFTFILALMSGCALTMTNTLNVIGERGQTGSTTTPNTTGIMSIPLTEYHYEMGNNFFYTLEPRSHISEKGHTDAGFATVTLAPLSSQWQQTTAIIDGEPVEIEARQYLRDDGNYEVQIRREYSRWYAYPADAAAIVIAPVDLAKNITINTALMSALMVMSIFTDVGFMMPSGSMGL